MTSQVLTALQTLATTLGKDELTIVAPFADNYFDNISKNPSPENVLAQTTLLETEVVTALPNIEAAAAKDIATALKTLMDTELASLNLVNQTAASNGSASTAA